MILWITRGIFLIDVGNEGNGSNWRLFDKSSLKFINHAEGYLEPAGGGIFRYVFQYKDHLGNIRLSYSDLNGNGLVNASEIIEENNYYPFGMKHRGYNGVVNGTPNTYKTFQGQEFTDVFGLNVHEWKYRISDPSIGRFWQIDPLAEEYVHNGTYNFSENRVIDAWELEGLEAKVISENKVEWKVKVTTGGRFTDDQVNATLKQTSQILSQNGLEITVVQNNDALFGIDMSKEYQSVKMTPIDGGFIAEEVRGEAVRGNPIDQTITSDGDATTTAHELGHAAGLKHIWEKGSGVQNTEENKDNVMNSDQNEIKEMKGTGGTKLNQNQTNDMKSTINSSQPRLKKIEENKKNN